MQDERENENERENEPIHINTGIVYHIINNIGEKQDNHGAAWNA